MTPPRFMPSAVSPPPEGAGPPGGGPAAGLRLFIIKIDCLGQRYYEVRAYASSCDAIIDTLNRYQRADIGIFVQRLRA